MFIVSIDKHKNRNENHSQICKKLLKRTFLAFWRRASRARCFLLSPRERRRRWREGSSLANWSLKPLHLVHETQAESSSLRNERNDTRNVYEHVPAQIQQLVEVHSAVGVLAEGPLLLELRERDLVDFLSHLRLCKRIP